MRPGDLVRVRMCLPTHRYWLYRYDAEFCRFRLTGDAVADGDTGVVLKSSPSEEGFFLLDAGAYSNYVQILVSGNIGWFTPAWLEVVS